MRPPVLQALLICEQAFQQAGSANWCIIGTYNTILLPKVPAVHTPFVGFISLGDFEGDALITLCVRDVEGKVVYAVRGQVPRVPMGTFDFALPFPPFEFKSTGSHMLELTVGDQVLAVRSFRVQQAMAPGPSELDPGRQL